MKVGDLVVQRGWEGHGVGIAIKLWGHKGGGEAAYITVRWPDGVVDMSPDDLEVISESW